jgi:hypothetical protein
MSYKVFISIHYDFINDKTTDKSGLSDRNDPYQAMEPPYKVKGTPLDSLEELRLIDGWDDEVHAVFSPYLTVWPYYAQQKSKTLNLLNLNTMASELKLCLLPSAADSARVETVMNYLEEVAGKKEGTQASSIVDAPTKIEGVLKDKFGYVKGDAAEVSARPETWFTTSSMGFLVKVKGTVGAQEVHHTVFVRRVPPKAAEDWRRNLIVKRSYQLLYSYKH